MAKTASLTAGLVAKGQAAPAVAAAPAGSSPSAGPAPRQASRGVGAIYYKALTVKLDRRRYEALKALGLKLDKSSQEIFVEALDAYIAGYR